MSQSWSIVILCYNEEGSIRKVCTQAIEVLYKKTNGDKQILIVDDASTDGSKNIIHELEKQFDIVEGIFHSENGGIGKVTQTAYKHARNDNIYIVSGDGEANVKEILSLPSELEDDTFYLFTRQKKVGYNFFRYCLTSLNRILNRILFGISFEDINWNKVVRKNQIEDLNLKLNSVLVDSEIVLKLLKREYKLIQINTISNQRLSGTAKGGSLTSVFNSIIDIFRLWKEIKTFQ